METTTAALDHQGLEVIPPDECWQLLAAQPVGRIAFVHEGDPWILPVNFKVVAHHIVIRTARGAILHEAIQQLPVAFEVDGIDPERRLGWSVLVRGIARMAEDKDELGDVRLHAWATSIERDQWVTIMVEEISGRRIAPRSGETGAAPSTSV